MGADFAAIKGAAAEMGFTVPEDSLGKYEEKIKEIEGLITQVGQGEDGEAPCDVTGRDKGFRPQWENNTHGQWAWRCYIEGCSEALNGGEILKGKKLAIKDSIAVAGIPMTCGNEHLKDFIPSSDAIVVERVLSSGGTIVGKATAENLCHSPLSYSSCQGIVRNPYDPTRTSGGSSSGNAVALALREVDMAVGSDSGCSVRAPAALCGCVGLKPTYGLVPTNGGAPCLWSTNHYGPMACNVEDCALLLDAIAGPDLFACPVAAALNRPNSYLDDIDKGIYGLKAGILTAGFLNDNTDNSNISQTVHTMIDKLRNIGMKAEEVSFPEFAEARPMLFLLASIEFGYVINNNGQPYPGRNFSMLDLKSAFQGIHKSLPQNAQIALLATQLFSGDISSKNIVEKTINRAKLLSKKLDALFSKYDVLILPTVPFPAPKLPSTMCEKNEEREKVEEEQMCENRGSSEGEQGQDRKMLTTIPGGCATSITHNDHNSTKQNSRGKEEERKKEKKKCEFIEDPVKMNVNCCLFNLTGHPAISVNCGFMQLNDETIVDINNNNICSVVNMPVGMQIVGPYMQESMLFRVAKHVQSMTRESQKACPQ